MSEPRQVQQSSHHTLLPATQEKVPFAEAETEGSLPQRFEHVVRTCPERIAIRSKRYELTFGDLNRLANRIARTIVAHGGSQDQPVALCLASDAPMIAAMLGALKAGRMYVPLDPGAPNARLERIFQDSSASLVLCDDANEPLARALGAPSLLNLNALPLGTADDNLELTIPPQTPAWLLYTSGSTGLPKGVVQTHGNVLRYAWHYAHGFAITVNDRYVLLYSCAVNGAAHVIFSSLLNGAGLYPFDIRTEGLAHLAEWLVANEITLYSSVPTVWRHFAALLNGRESLSRLRLMVMIGEPVYSRDVELCRMHCGPGCVFVNRFGSTETGSLCWCFLGAKTQLQGIQVPIGHAVRDHELLLRADDDQPVPCGEIGEIVVRSRYLSPGYWRRPDLTQAAFLPDPEGSDGCLYLTGDMGCMLPDGRLLCLGRKDHQIKIAGYRVEAAEVETALLQHPAIREVVVMARQDEGLGGDARLVAYLVPSGGVAPTVSDLRRYLARTLPEYMIPSQYVHLGHLPLAPNGKVDRRALPPPAHARPPLDTAFVAPGTALEAVLAGIWAEVLVLDAVGIHDNLLELGGTSLLATRILSRVQRAIGVELSLQELFQTPSIAGLGQAVAQALRDGRHGHRPPLTPLPRSYQRMPPSRKEGDDQVG